MTGETKKPDEGVVEAIASAIVNGTDGNAPLRPGGEGGELTRSDFRPELVEAIRRASTRSGAGDVLSADEREASRRSILTSWEPGTPLYVFGYGSLMWNPAIEIRGNHAATLHGYHRAFCLSLKLGRGTPENPGLMLALVKGGSARGRALEISPERVESETSILWMREMLSGAYLPSWVRMRVAGREERGITFIANMRHERFVGKLAVDVIAARIAAASGILGKNRDYLYKTVAELKALGLTDGPIHRLEKQVRAITGE